MNKKYKPLLSLPVIVAALGYFVDIYDLLLFGIVRIPSLQSMGLNQEQVSLQGVNILNWQMTGLLIGGILWGVLGDRKGRLSVLFGSILTYSIANILCGLVESVSVYKLLRFIAGVGLAGELGAGITLVSEIVPKRSRGIATSLVAGVGLLGAVFAYFTVELFEWRMSYLVGGGLGFLLLLLRFGVFESGIFIQLNSRSDIIKGNFFALLTSRDRRSRYLKCIGMGLPTWFVIGILATFSDEFASSLGIKANIDPGLSIMWCYIGLSLGDIFSGILSHFLKSRKMAVFYLMLFTFFTATFYLYAGIKLTYILYTVIGLLGFGIGYWAMFVTIGAEQFGTNLRATATTTIPNVVRGTVVLMTTFFVFLKGHFSVVNSGAIVGLITFLIGFYSILTLPETFDKDLDFLEE